MQLHELRSPGTWSKLKFWLALNERDQGPLNDAAPTGLERREHIRNPGLRPGLSHCALSGRSEMLLVKEWRQANHVAVAVATWHVARSSRKWRSSSQVWASSGDIVSRGRYTPNSMIGASSGSSTGGFCEPGELISSTRRAA